MLEPQRQIYLRPPLQVCLVVVDWQSNSPHVGLVVSGFGIWVKDLRE